jgi:hypothetical protein
VIVCLKDETDLNVVILIAPMLNKLRFMSHLISIAMLLLGAGLLSMVPVANSLMEDENQQFRTDYLESCLSGTTQLGVPSTQAESYCRCTADQILSLPEQKLQVLSTMKPQDLQVDPEIHQIVIDCWQPLTELKRFN